LASVIKNYSSSWHWVFVIAAIMNLKVAMLALFIVRTFPSLSHQNRPHRSRRPS
jgi:sugar phosphate permease